MKRAFLFTLALPTLVFAQQRALTVDEAVQLATENNRSLKITQAKAEAADARWSELNASRFPSAKLQGSYSRLSEVDPFAVQVPFSPTAITISPVILNNYAARLSIQQPLFTGFRLDESVSAAEYAAEASHKDVERDRAELVFATRSAYWNLYRARELKRVVTENVQQVRAHRTDVENAMKHGLATRNDLLKVEVQLSNTRLMEIEAANAVKIVAMTLNNIIGLPLETEIAIATSVSDSTQEAPDPLPRLLERAMSKRSDLRAMEIRVMASEASVKAAQGGWYPQLFLAGNYYFARPNPRILPARDEFKSTWDVSLSLSFDIWNWMTPSHQAAQALAALTQAQQGLAQLRDAVTLEVTHGYLEVAKAREKLSVAALGVEQAEENYRTTKSKFSAGVATNTDLLDSEVAVLQSKTNNLASWVDVELSKARLAKSTGE